MKSYVVRKTQRGVSLKRDKNRLSEEGLRASSIGERENESSERRGLRQTKNRAYTRSVTRTQAVPYEPFVRELKIRLPTPKQKFYQFLRIAPFNRVQNQNDMICLFIKNTKFFQLHQPSLVLSMARKLKMVDLSEIDTKMMVIILEGSLKYCGHLLTAGQLVNRDPLDTAEVRDYDPSTTKLLALNRHQYYSFLYGYINQEMIRFKQFINCIQTFKMFTEKTLQKFTQNMTLHYYLKGSKLYRVGDQATTLFVVFSGLVSRKVIIELQQINKIPPYAKKGKDGSLLYEKYKRDVRILTKEYEHKIEFKREDMVGVSEVIDKVAVRKEEIDVDEDTVLLGIDRTIVEQNLDDYILDHLKKYNLKKYPSSYDELCDIYLKEKLSCRRMEERKIMAMQNELKLHYNDHKREKIESIIKMYESNIRTNLKVNLKKQRLEFEIDKNK